VPRTLELIKERCPNTRIAVMFHETFTGEQGPGPQIMRLWQKKQVKKLCAIADKILVSTTAWLPQLGSEASQRAISLPVGSNVSECRIDRGAARLAYSIPEDHFVLGVFGNAHVSRQFEWIGYAAARLLEAGMRVGVLYIGADGERVSGYFDGVKFVDAGPLPSGDAGKALRAADLFASPFTDGFTTRRGSVMAALQHSVAVIATDGFRTEQWLRDYKPAPMYLVSPNNREAFATATVQLAKEPERRRQFERNGIAFYREECDWPVIAKRLESSFSGCESN
jgi:glycosyltransferase involved in cell wall biosynthesis